MLASKCYVDALRAYEDGNHAEALKLLDEHLLSIGTGSSLQPECLASSLLLAGNIHAARGEIAECDRRYREAYELLTLEHGGEHAGHASLLVNHSSVLIRRFQVLRHQTANRAKSYLIVEALRMLHRAYQILEPLLDLNRVILADCCHNIGVCLETLGQFVDALEYYMKSLKIRCRSHHNPELTQLCLATTMENVAMVYRLMHASLENDRCNTFLEKSEEIMGRVLFIRRSILGKKSGGVAEAEFNLALVHTARGNSRQAMKHFQSARNTRAEFFGASHDVTTLSELVT